MLNGGLFYFSLNLFLTVSEPVNPAGIPIVLAGNLFFSSHYLTSGVSVFRDEREVEKLIDRILDRYADAGFPFCRVRPRPAGPFDAPGTMILAVEEGARIRISDHRFKIRGRTDPRSLKKWLRVRNGEFFSRRELERIKARLRDSGLFCEVRDRITRYEEEHFLEFELEEASSDYLSAGGSLAQNDAFFFGELDSRNLLGTLRSMRAQYEYRKLVRIAYDDPILIAPVDLKLEFRLATSDSGRLTGLSGQLSAPVTDRFRVMIRSGREIVSYAEPDRPGYQSNLVGTGLSFSPRPGSIHFEQNMDVEYLFRSGGRLKFRFDADVEAWNAAIEPHYWWTLTDRFEYFDYVRVGGARTVRGYLEEEIAGRSVIWLNAEYGRYLLYPLFDLVWADGALYYAYGLGLKGRSSLGQASLAFAWPKGGAWTDGKIHFFLEKSF